MTGVLVVDDSQFMRTVVGNALDNAGYDVRTADTGEAAIEAVASDDAIDVITMDVEMPGMGGIEAVERIMTHDPTPILVLSAHTEAGADATLEALDCGALDVLQKPDGTGTQNLGHLTDAVVAKVDELSAAPVSALALARATAAVTATERRQVNATQSASGVRASAGTGTGTTEVLESGNAGTLTARGPSTPPTMDAPAPVDGTSLDHPTVVIGASTGGPKIIEQLLAHLPADLEAKVLIVQHMPADFTRRLATRLDAICAYDVFEASDGDRIDAGDVAIARGGQHLRVVNNVNGSLRVRLDDGERVHGVRPAIDVTMETAAQRVVDPLCGVVLTGMGRDGAAGIEAIADAGGHTIAQDEATSPVFGIPQQAIRTGRVDEVVPASALVDRIVGAFVTDGETDE
ncbi:chemotaxis-specific protein-glutamate methyltransferase CheB [Natronosalvus rutilus]|uniref:Protein-glutamate methylesterase/protein-glutamine glutaminase n=1 Tax=Natronosalvus rutilus TaxID=2953753 RepID=A0A9E7N941_9EURY|nr:chemotaxis-specific protein-glutamate methyltransferase CheB [Natronosalvus rutilus]UTF54074.1 chemotaxis-specific protein-glutamate methyltransferase CheB [Natronosalvus rutilus]